MRMLVLAVMVAMVAIVLAACNGATPAPAAGAIPGAPTERITQAIIESLIVTANFESKTTLEMGAQPITDIGASGTDFSATGGLTLADDLTLSDGDATVADFLAITPQTGLVITDVITPTGTYQPISAASPITATLSAGSAGQLLIVVNTGANAITIADTATTAGTYAMGQHDSLMLLNNGSAWVEISRSNN